MSAPMIFNQNARMLKASFPDTWRKIEADADQDTTEPFTLRLETAKNGFSTLVVEKEGKKLFLHSKYDPQREAEAFTAQFTDVDQETTVVFYGTGLGFQISSFLQKHPTVRYYLYEPIPELMKVYLTHQVLQDLPGKNLRGIVSGTNEDEIQRFLQVLIDKTQGKLLLVELPMHKQIFAPEYKRFLELFQHAIKNKRTSLHTHYAYQKRWVINSIKNFKEVLYTPNIVMGAKGRFKGKPALLVAAGPSLSEEIENLRFIKENGLAYIFSVGSAVNTLINYHIYPHATCTYDPTEKNLIVFSKLKEEGIKDIPLIFGSSVWHEIPENYPGQKFHMITSQDTVSNYFLKTNEHEKLTVMYDAPTIAVVTLQLLYALGFNPIILVGQNLAYRGEEKYAVGIDYATKVTPEQRKEGLWVKDVDGNQVLTRESFVLARKQMELYIKHFSGCQVINTTKGGAHIEGSIYLELDEVIAQYLTEQVDDGKWLSDVKNSSYNRDYLISQLESMDRAHQRAIKLSDEYCDVLNKISKLIGNGNYGEAEKMYIKLNKTLRKIERNKFFTVFLLPMNRVQYKILADSIDSLNEEKNPLKKGQRIVERFKHFIDLCKRDLQFIIPFYEELKGEILSYKG